MKKILMIILLLVGINQVKADEGMWIPSLIGKNYNQMKRAGLKLTAKDIYDINNASLKDAIVSLGGFCTAEIVSNQGLLFTNHHCAFNAIADQSSAENNYLENGYWAMDNSKELTTKAYAAILKNIVDVTPTVMIYIKGLPEDQRKIALKKVQDSLVASFKKEKYEMVNFAEFFSGNQYFVFVYDKYTDVRLVGAPPSSIGKFGGDTDNWMWPRHTGDFSVMRIYAGADNKPADYSKDNKPFVPKKSLPISIKGLKNNDYAMIMGFPGRTQRYEFSKGIERMQATENPIHIKYWKMITETMKTEMDKDVKTSLQLAGRYAQLMNYYKYTIGQNTQLKRLRTVENLKEKEMAMQTWIAADPTRMQDYGTMFNDVAGLYTDFMPYETYRNIIRYGLNSIPTLAHGLTYYNTLYTAAAKDKNLTAEDLKKSVGMPFEALQEGLLSFYEDANFTVEKNTLKQFLSMAYTDLSANQRTATLNELGNDEEKINTWVNNLYATSALLNETKEKAFLSNMSAADLLNDPLMKFVHEFYGNYKTNYLSKSMAQQSGVSLLKRKYAQANLAMNPDKLIYPDANSTERITYGNVKDYDGLDAIHYHYITFAEGILEKEDNTNEEFKVDAKQHNLLMAKDYGRYADKKTGKLPIAFLTTNDITGGNSGSPVINAKGEQIGIAFDGNWEAMSGDIDFSGDQKRTICVDIRYVLWCIDKYAGAGYLINELSIVE
jgi:hypothetical protein